VAKSKVEAQEAALISPDPKIPKPKLLKLIVKNFRRNFFSIFSANG